LAGLLAITRISQRSQDPGGAAALAAPALIALIVTCVVMVVGFIRIERRSPAPMLKLEYFRRRNFTLPMVSAAMVQFAYMGGFVVTPALLGTLYGLGVGAIALMMVPRPGVFSLASPIGGYLASRIGERRPIILGAVLMMASMLAFAGASLVDLDGARTAGLALILIGLALSGASAGVSQPSVAAMVAGAVDEEDLGIANGMNQQIMFIGIVSGIQTMNVLVGDSAGPSRFAWTFGLGLAVATLGLVAAVGVSDRSS
jgi:MFS family permease